MPVTSLFRGTQNSSPPKSFQALPAGVHGRALASSQRVTSSWLPLSQAPAACGIAMGSCVVPPQRPARAVLAMRRLRRR